MTPTEHESGKWIGAITGGLVCLIWSVLPNILVFLSQDANPDIIQPFLSSIFEIYSVINFFILPFCIFGAGTLINLLYLMKVVSKDTLNTVRARDLIKEGWLGFPIFITLALMIIMSVVSCIYQRYDLACLVIILIGVFSACTLISFSSYSKVSSSNLGSYYIIVNGCGGALAGILIVIMYHVYDLACLVIIPSLIFVFEIGGFVCVPSFLSLVYYLFFIFLDIGGNWQNAVSMYYIKYLASTPFEMLLLASPSLSAIPASILFGYEAGRFVQFKLLEFRLKSVESYIEDLQKTIEKHHTDLAHKNEIEQKINRIVAIDPHNFGIKAAMFREHARTITDNQIQLRMAEIDIEMQRKTQLIKQAEEKLCALEGEKEALERRLKEIRNRLRILEVVDPANIKIKMQKLQTEWEGVKRDDLEKIEAAGELEALFKEQLLLNFQIKEKTSEVEDQRKEVAHLNLTVDALQLEKHVLELAIIDRKIKSEEPCILELRNKLTDLQTKRDRIKQSLQHQKQS